MLFLKMRMSNVMMTNVHEKVLVTVYIRLSQKRLSLPLMASVS